MTFDVFFYVIVLLRLVLTVKKVTLAPNEHHFVALFFFFLKETFPSYNKKVIHQPCWNHCSSLILSAGAIGINSADEQRISVF